jgi:hypothetical protein
MNRAWVLFAGLVVGLAGCVGSKGGEVQGRSQIGEDPAADPDAFAAVGQKTTVGNTEPIQISGVGLVYRLAPGTGSSPPPGGWRVMLENSLKKQGYTNVKELLDDPARTTSLVLVSALVPPGARKGDPIDIQITLPDESKTTSLKGGVLFHCELVNFDTTGNLKSLAHEGKPTGPSGNLALGSVWATAGGPVVAGTFTPTKGETGRAAPAEADAQPTYRIGRVWGGGRVTQTRPYFFLMNPGDQNVRMAATVADRLCSTFHATADPNTKVADAKTRELVIVNVPPAYRHNHYRFLLVARQVPVVPVAADSLHRRKLEEELLDPATALRAAVKLEALGGDSHRSLRLGLHHASPWVRFAAAEALAYLGHTDGAGELAKLAEDHPALRAHCLKALASIDDGASTDRLGGLMAGPDASLRYGAFLALRMTDERNPAVGGQLLNNSFWLHRVAPGSAGLVHLTGARRSEVVVFGDRVALRGPVPPLPIGSEFTVSMPAEQGEVKLTRVVRVKGEAEVREAKCPPDLAAVLAALARLGGGYGEAVELLRKADRAQVLSAPVVVDAIPGEMTVQQLAGFARTDPDLVKANVEVARVGAVRPDLDQVGLDLPADPDPAAKTAEAAPARPPLSRDPGRIFGPKRPPEPANADGLTPVVPAAATESPPPTRTPELSRDPGRLFGPRKSGGTSAGERTKPPCQ